MKTRSFITAVLMVIGVAVASAQTVSVEKKNANVFKIAYSNETVGKVKVSITNAEGSEVYAETLASVKNFALPLNFVGMEEGAYTVEIASATGKSVETINYASEPIIKTVHVTKLADASKYLLAVTSEGTEQFNVKIFDSANQLVLDEMKNSNNGFATVYNLKNLTGAFTIEVSDQSGYTKTIRY